MRFGEDDVEAWTDGGLGGQEHMLLLLIPVEAEYYKLQWRTVNVYAGWR